MARRASLASWSRKVFWLGGEPDARAVQFGFVVLLHLALLGEQSVQVGVVDPALWALRLSLLVLVATFVLVPRLLRPGLTVRVLAHVDLALIGLSACALDVGTLPLVVLPAMWLGRELRWGAVWRVGLSTTVLVSVPGTLVHGNHDGTAVQLLSLPFIAMVAAVSITVGLDAASRAQAEAEEQRAEAERQRNEAQGALAELERQRRATDAIVETVDVGLVLLDPDGRVLLRNGPQAEIDDLKYPAGRGRCLPRDVFGEDGTTPLPMLGLPSTLAARGEEFDDYRIWVGSTPTTRRALSVSARQVHDPAGQRIGAALAFKDVTELMRALHIKNEFIALVFHELRTPLTSIHGYTSILLEDDDLPARATRQLEVVARNTDRLQTLVDDLLEAAQVAGGAIRLRRARTDLVGLVREALEAAAPQADEAQVSLTADLPASVSVDVDAQRISQVLDNLVSNALKYTPPGGWARVEVHTRADRVEVRVADSGIGIRADDLAELFTNFFRTQEAGDRAIQGVGLGLAISRTIVESHGGRIEVASRPGSGSVFTVVLPVDHEEHSALRAVS